MDSPQCAQANSSELAMKRQRSLPSDSNGNVMNKTLKSGQSLHALLRLSTVSSKNPQQPQHPQTARNLNTTREKFLPPKTTGPLLGAITAANVP